MKKIIFIIPLLLITHLAFSAVPPEESAAQTDTTTGTSPTVSSEKPVTISAVKSLEWNRKEKTYTAHQDVIATQGTTKLKSDILVAHYADTGSGSSDINTMNADGHVTINDPPYTAYGDHAVYNVKTGNAILTGKDLKIVSDDSILTAKDRIEYNGKEDKMTAVGSPVATKGENTLTADAMSAYFTKDDAGKMAANKITSHGNVVIKTPTETATGDDGVYDVTTQKAVLTGKVRILQDKNWLEGTRADVDMATGISQLSGTGNTSTDGRVTGMFFPQPKDKPTGDKAANDKPAGSQKTEGQKN